MKKRDLTTGNILSNLMVISIPVIGSSLMQSAYNMVDMFWLGRVGSKAVASSGTAGFYLWFIFGIVLLVRIGTEVKVAHSSGENNHKKVLQFARNGIKLSVIIATICLIIVLSFTPQLISFFNIQDKHVVDNAIVYLRIVSPAIFFIFLNQIFTGIFNGLGNTKIPFYFSTIGIISNIILDPILIFNFNLGVLGAALATAISGFIPTILFITYAITKSDIFVTFNLFEIDIPKAKEILKLGAPNAIQSMTFTFISMIIGIFVAKYGAEAIAAQKVGAMIESLSWMVASGIQTALTAFVGQNYGAKKWNRLVSGYGMSLRVMGLYGLLLNIFFYFGAGLLMTVFFINEPATVAIGIPYLQIIAISQVFMILEITTTGAFNGVGKTKTPATIGLVGNLIRIPLSLILMNYIGINGIWWSISFTSILKGIFSIILFVKHINNDTQLDIKYMFSTEGA